MTKRIALWAVVGVVVLSVAWRYGVPAETRDRAVAAPMQAGWDVLVGAGPERKSVTWPGYRVPEEQLRRMAKTQVTGSSYGGSLDICWRFPEGSDQGEIWYVHARCGVIDVIVDSLGASGDGVDFRIHADSLAMLNIVSFDLHVPYVTGGITEVRIPVTWSMTAGTLNSVYTSSPIGEKGQTHAKEGIVTESWQVENADCTITINGNSGTCPYTGTMPLAYQFGNVDTDDDRWDEITGYVVSFENVMFCGEAVDLSAVVAQNWPGYTDKWVEGTSTGTLGLWGHTPGSGHYTWGGCTVNAPYNVGVNAQIRYMDWTEVSDSLLIICPTIRNIDTDTHTDLGPKEYTYGEFKGLRHKQKYGFISLDPNPADVIPPFKAYLKMSSAEGEGIDIRGSRPEYKVEGAGYGQTIVGETITPGPLDGQYAAAGTYNGETLYSNGYGFLYCTDPDAQNWALGPGPPTSPFYIQDGSGPGGSYLVNTDSYTDDIIDEETGQRRFSGLLGEGVGPAVSADTTEAIATDADCATPSFQHNATLVINGWGLAALNRSDSPYMTNIVSIAADATKSVYANAHDHTDWVGVNCTTPDSGGNFTVGAGGGSLTFTPKCNYRDRQAKVGGIGEVAAPDAYRKRRHDACLGEGATPETAEGVWDWRGHYVKQSFRALYAWQATRHIGTRTFGGSLFGGGTRAKPPAVPLTVTVRYYMDLLGVTDNHKTDSTRQTEYAYDPGELYTLTRTIPVSHANDDGWSAVLVDLYDEINAGLPVAMAYDLKWEFPTAGEYRMSAPYLVTDPGDRQEITSVAPYYREAPGGDGLSLKIDESVGYAQGVVSMVFNGYANMALFMPDHAKPCIVEKCFDTLNVLIGAQTGEDLTSCYALSGWPITNSGEALTYSYSAAAEQAHMVDEDLASLKTLAVSDIVPQVTGGTIGAVAVRCAEFYMVNGLPYVFDIVHVVQGRGHGMLVTQEAEDTPGQPFPRKRNSGGIALHRTANADDGLHPWMIVESGIASDEHGHFASGAHEIHDRLGARALWDYGVKHRGEGAVENIGRFATREFALGQAAWSGLGQCSLARDAMGYPIWAACELEGTVNAYALNDFDFWHCPGNPALTGANYKYASICTCDDGSIIVGATNTDQGRIDVVRSRNNGTTWEAVNTAFGTGLVNGHLFHIHGQVYLVGWADDKVWLVTSSQPDLTREVMDGTNSIIKVCAHAVGAGEDAPQCSVIVDDTGQIMVAVAGDADTRFYSCRNFRTGFSLVA